MMKVNVPEVLTREQMNEFENENLLDYRNTDNRQTVDQRFTEMNRQISELTNLVLALTEKMIRYPLILEKGTYPTLCQINMVHVPTGTL